MRFGCCVGPELVPIAAEAGYDFVELPIVVLLPEQPDEEFEAAAGGLTRAPITPEVWQLTFPAGVRVCGPEVDWPRVSRYVHTAFRRAVELSGAAVAFPCGRVCRAPPGFPRGAALDQVCDFLRVCCAVARRQGLTVAVEPVSPECGNLVNTVPDATALAERVNSPELGVLPSLGQMAELGHSVFDIVDAAQWLAHVHVSAGSLAAAEEAEGQSAEFRRALELAGYDGRISVYADWDSPREELERARDALQRWWQSA